MNLKSKSPQPIKMIFGLGNPGSIYQNTYHNAGYLFLGWLIKHKSSELKNLILIKSPVFMNESGLAVKAALQRFKIKPAALVVAHDDSDIVFGKFKLSFGRNSAGHHGVESIIKILKTKNFWRLRIGVRKENVVRQKAGLFILKNFHRGDIKKLEETFKKALPSLYQLTKT